MNLDISRFFPNDAFPNDAFNLSASDIWETVGEAAATTKEYFTKNFGVASIPYVAAAVSGILFANGVNEKSRVFFIAKTALSGLITAWALVETEQKAVTAGLFLLTMALSARKSRGRLEQVLEEKDKIFNQKLLEKDGEFKQMLSNKDKQFDSYLLEMDAKSQQIILERDNHIQFLKKQNSTMNDELNWLAKVLPDDVCKNLGLLNPKTPKKVD